MKTLKLLKISTLVATVVAASALAGSAFAGKTTENNFINLGLNGQYSFASKANLGQTSSKVRSMGYGVSAGYEYALTPSFRLGAEVGYEDLGKSNYTFPNTNTGPASKSNSTPTTADLYNVFTPNTTYAPTVTSYGDLRSQVSKYQKEKVKGFQDRYIGPVPSGAPYGTVTYKGETYTAQTKSGYHKLLEQYDNQAENQFMKDHNVTPISTGGDVPPFEPGLNNVAQNVQIKESMFTVLATADYFVNPNWDIIGKFGPAWVMQKNEIHVGPINESVSAHKIAPYLNIGTAYHFDNNMSLGVSYGHLFGSKINSIDDLENTHKVQSVNSVQLDLGYTFPF